MWYLFSSSFLWTILIIVAMVYLNAKINRLSDRFDSISGKERVPFKKAPPATAEPLTASSATFSSSTVPVADTPKKEKADSEETGSRWLGKIGVVAIVLGVSFFLKWAFDNNLIGPMGRIALGIIAGIVMVGIGQFLRKKYLVYSDIVSGGGIAILYLTIFAAFAFYHFIGNGTAMILMFSVTALSVTLSVIGGTIHLAVLGVLGGFLTPILIRSGENNLFSLMGYLTLLDLGVLGVAVFRKWTHLNLLGFAGTMLHFSLWYSSFYSPAQLGGTLFFLTIFFLIYLVAGIIHNVLWKKNSTGVDFLLITLAPACYGLMSFVLLDPKYHGILGFFMLILAVLYFVVSFVAYRVNPSDKTLNLYLLGVAVIFLTVAMPLQFSGLWITLAWFLEAGLLALVGNLTRRHAMNIFAVAVYTTGLIRYFSFDATIKDLLTHTPVFNSQVFLMLVAIAVAYLIGSLLVRHADEEDAQGRRQTAIVFIVLANILSLYILTFEIHTSYTKDIRREEQKSVEARSTFYQLDIERSERQQVEYARGEDAFRERLDGFRNRRNTVISIVWALYAAVLTAIGFVAKRRIARILGLILFFVTALKVLIDVWALGQLYRIISSISFGVIALVVSFAYAKWKHRLKEVL